MGNPVPVSLHEGVRAVVVDAFEILRFHGEPGDIFICDEPFRNLPDDILHEHGLLISFFSDVLFIRAFKDGIDVTTGAALYEVDDVLNPDESFETEMDGHQASLIVSPMLTDFLGAWTNGGDGDDDTHIKVLNFIA